MAAVSVWLAAARASENFIALPTELKFSSVSVSVRAPMGAQYRPGVAFPLEIHINNPGAAMDAGLIAVEGGGARASGGEGGDWAERTVAPAVTLAPGTSRFILPMRAPGISAAITLVLRGGTSGGGQAELFRASLSQVLRPLPSGGRNVLVCGAARRDAAGPQDQTLRFAPLDLPAEDWMWESVDRVVLNDASIKDAKAESRDALRRWLLGGGRMFLGSREALAAALGARLLPIETPGDVGADFNWWEKNAGLKKEDVLAVKNFRPVYARLRRGFGQIVFLFPGSEANDADGAAVFNRADLQRRRIVLPDARVQPERFGAFAQAAPSARRRRDAMFYAAVGALILCAALLLARKSQSKLEAVLLPLVAGAVLTGLLAKGFPQQELSISRLAWERRSADGAGIVREEWALLEAIRDPVERTARGLVGGTLAPRFEDLDDLRAARLNRWNDDGVMALGKVVAAPNQPALLYAARTESARGEKPGASETVLNVVGKSDGPRAAADALSGMDLRRALWIRADGSVSLLQMAAGRDDYETESYSPRALETALTKEADAALAKARATALNWAVEDALGEGGEALIVWNAAPRLGDALISIDGDANGAGNDFYVRTVFRKR